MDELSPEGAFESTQRKADLRLFIGSAPARLLYRAVIGFGIYEAAKSIGLYYRVNNPKAGLTRVIIQLFSRCFVAVVSALKM